MKALPLLALILGVGVLLMRQNTARTLEHRNTTLETRVVEAESAAHRHGIATPGEEPGLAGKTARDKATGGSTSGLDSIDEIDLEALAASMETQTPGRMPDLKQVLRMQRLLLAATPEELAALIARVGDLDVSDAIKQSMVQQFIGVLARTDPEGALGLAIASPHMDLHKNSWAFTNGFSSWMKDAPDEALAWFDAQIAAGTFESKSLDGKSQARLQFEAAALAKLLTTDPAAALARIEALPEDHRLGVFQQGHLLHRNKGSEEALAELARDTLPADQQLPAFASLSHHLVTQGGYERVAEFMDNIGVSPEERRALAGQAANKSFQQMGADGKPPGPGEIATMQEFATSQAPGEVDAITGEALAHVAQRPEQFDNALQMVRDLHAENPNDDLLVGFLQQSHFMKDKEAARALAGQIEDAEQRERILSKLE